VREKKAPTKAAAPPRAMTGRQLSRHRRESRLQRIAIAGVALALVLVVLVPLYGYWREVLAKGDQPIAVVHGQTITTDLYARFLGHQQALLQREIQRVVEKSGKAEANSPERQSAQLELQLLQQRAQTLPYEAVDQLIDAKLIRDEAARRGLTAGPAEVDAALQQEMSDYPLAGYGYTFSSPGSTDLESVDQARQDLKALLGKGKLLTEDEVRTLILEDRVFRTKLQSQIGESVKTSGEQVRARHILVDTEDQAREVLARLQKGEDFPALARELSKDTSNKDSGGELGWFPRGKMVPEFDDAAFSLKAGEISRPVKTTYGYHVVQIEEKSDNRPFDDAYVQQQRAKLFDDWLTSQRSDPTGVERLDSPDKIAWAGAYVSKQLQSAK